jgi:hypothetical protein
MWYYIYCGELWNCRLAVDWQSADLAAVSRCNCPLIEIDQFIRQEQKNGPE